MADATFKTSSGDDLILSNDDGSKKIEVPESGDVEVTGDLKTTTVKATNLKANDGSAGLSIADSTGRVTFSENNPVINLGSNATFPDGTLVKSEFFKYTSGDFGTVSEVMKAVRNYQSFSCTVGNTIIFIFNFLAEQVGNGQNVDQRRGTIEIYQSTSAVSANATSSLGTLLNQIIAGRILPSTSSNGANGFFPTNIQGSFLATNTTHYLGITAKTLAETTCTFTVTQNSSRPLTLSIYEYKGDVLT